MKYRILLVVCCCLLCFACARSALAPESVPAASAPLLKPTASQPSPAPTPTAEPEPSPTPVSVTLGAVGDIMVVPKHLTAALHKGAGEYDFSFCFPAVSDMFRTVDVMCGNLEGALPGGGVDRYSSRQIDGYGTMRFGAPDVFAQTLKDAGFDFLTTANNHAADYGVDGMVQTMDTLDAYGILHTGTFRSQEARKQPCIIEIRGVRIGFVATTTVYNEGPGITEEERNEMLSRTQFMDRVLADIQNCRAAGAEFIVMFPHWDYEYETQTASGTRQYARAFLEAGAGAVIGSHPHVVQPMRYETVTRADGTTYTGLVAYSLGNFLTSETFETSCGLYVQLEITKDTDGAVFLSGAGYMPTYCMDRYIDGLQYHQMVPALSDPGRLTLYNGEPSEHERKRIASARKFVVDICGTDVVPLMEDSCWKS